MNAVFPTFLCLRIHCLCSFFLSPPFSPSFFPQFSFATHTSLHSGVIARSVYWLAYWRRLHLNQEANFADHLAPAIGGAVVEVWKLGRGGGVMEVGRLGGRRRRGVALPSDTTQFLHLPNNPTRQLSKQTPQLLVFPGVLFSWPFS